jgi:hypothetical protein
LEEEQGLLEQLNQNLETFNKELTDEITLKDAKILKLNKEVESLEAMIVEQDDTADKLKERSGELQKQIKVLRDHLEESSGDASKDKITLLLEKQNKLIKQLRESDVRQLAT